MKLTAKELRVILSKPPGQLTADDLRWLRPDQIESLSLHHVAGLSTPILLGLNAKQLGALTQEQVSVLSLAQMGLVPASVKRKAVRLQVNLARTERAKAAETDRAVVRWQAWLFLVFLLLIPILRILHALNLI